MKRLFKILLECFIGTGEIQNNSMKGLKGSSPTYFIMELNDSIFYTCSFKVAAICFYVTLMFIIIAYFLNIFILIVSYSKCAFCSFLFNLVILFIENSVCQGRYVFTS
ncbi:hypothetical protein PAEPH01_1772 [Pancytospora epiphaga]|nr:hypothetical protein PAEPH01_1772 [Pancytospora epiphaga]